MENFADIEGPVRIGILSIVIWSVAAVLLLAGIAYLLTRLLRKGAASPEQTATAQRSPLEIAVSRLESLRKTSGGMDADAFTVEVADIVRDYLEASLEIPAREQTSEEFLLALRERDGLPDILHAHMPGFLEQCDRVKFARQVLGNDQREGLIETAGTVVRETETTLQPEPLEQEPAISK